MSIYSVLYHLLDLALWQTAIHNHEIKIRKGCRWYRTIITKEHIITVITEPGYTFLTHITSFQLLRAFLTVSLIITIRTISI